MRTPYSERNAEFTSACHEVARKVIYPDFFRVTGTEVSFEDGTLVGQSKKGDLLDGELSVDYQCRVSVNRLRHPLSFWFQERFREPKYASYNDLTVTEWNTATNLPSELYKIHSGFFLYGYANADKNNIDKISDFVSAIIVNVEALKLGVAHNRWGISPRANPRSKQTFLTFGFKQLCEMGLVPFYRYNGSNFFPVTPEVSRVELVTNS